MTTFPKSLLTLPPALMALVLAPVAAASAEVPSTEEVPAIASPSVVVATKPTDLATILNYNSEIDSSKTAQVTSVSELSDVKPTDWAFTALQSLVERYGCIAGYPDKTYRGRQALSRYEFAAGLNACLDKINVIISAGLADKVSKEDLAALQKLQEEFATELAALRGRVDALEAKTAQLESQQFSTTTKLSGLATFNVTGASGSGVIRETGRRTATGAPERVEATNPNLTMSGLVWLTFNTSFTGSDLLITQLAAGNGNSPANTLLSAGQFNNAGVPYFDQTSGATQNAFILRELSYTFPVFGNSGAKLAVGPRLNFYKYFDDNRFTSIFDGGSFNSTSSTFLSGFNRGAGAVLTAPLADWVTFAIGYLAESNEFLTDNAASNPRVGLFGGNSIFSTEFTFKPAKDLNLRLGYHRYDLEPNVLASGGEPLLGVVDDGFGGALNNAQSDIFAFNFDWLIAKGFGLFGRYTYNSTNLNAANAARSGSITSNAYQIGLAFPDLFKEGARASISYVIPNSIGSGKQFFVAGAGDGGTQQELEFSYYYPVSKNVAIVPNLYFIFSPNNISSNPSIFVGNVSLRFAF